MVQRPRKQQTFLAVQLEEKGIVGLMPFFENNPGRGAPLAIAKDRDSVLAYTLTPAAVRRLRESGVRNGRKFPASILASLIRSGDAHSPRPADAAGQAFLFTEEDAFDELPRCEMTGSTADLHLSVYAEGSATVAKLLSPEARFLVQKSTTLSIPIWALNSETLGQMEVTGKMPKGTAAATTLRQWFLKDYAGAWEKLRKSHAQQEALDLGPAEGELPLAEAQHDQS